DRFEGRIPGGDAGPAGQDHGLDGWIGALFADDPLDVGGLVADDRRARDPVAPRAEQFLDEGAARVALRCLGVGNREDEAGNRSGRVSFVLARRRVPVPFQFTSPYFVLGRRRSAVLKMPHGMLTVGETTREPAYAGVASFLGPRLARNLERH